MMRALSFLLLLGCGDGRDDPMPDAGPPCPAEPQLGDESCEAEGQRCLFVRCPDDAAYESRCEAGTWVSTRRPCATHECGGVRCESTELCVERVGGAFIVECGENPCGPDAVEASCACSLCGENPCVVSGRIVECDTCSSDICP
jgi:hypothetical protein